MKEKCPVCGSENLEVYIERISTYYYGIDKDGNIKDRPSRINKNSGENASGYHCKDCGEYIGKLFL